ncbi:hypothetical protein DQQ10_02755 [Pseudochryseolinea flava]|uniref:Uncharacterized protein n=2 Tax=Pseudochryseolinea flava TaxID=2059302 RepID=A0A364Y7E7_9BACT|nr:hypothetical protein DQQ10_02755 [Pseudochryseolinea flava]
MSPKKVIVLALAISISVAGSSQTVKVKKESAGVKNQSVAGYIVTLDGALADVTNSFSKYLKGYGKVKQNDVITVSEPTVMGIKYISSLYGITQEKGNATTSVWLGFDRSTLTKEQVTTLEKELENVLHDFGVQYYRSKIQVQVDESSRAYQAVERQQQKLSNESKSLATRLEDNKREKAQLEKSLEANKAEHEALLKKIEKNKQDQDSVVQAGVQVKKIVEMHREKQRKVN